MTVSIFFVIISFIFYDAIKYNVATTLSYGSLKLFLPLEEIKRSPVNPDNLSNLSDIRHLFIIFGKQYHSKMSIRIALSFVRVSMIVRGINYFDNLFVSFLRIVLINQNWAG
jgi:hypothetical protein